jgi:hypothetical protein
MNPKLWALPPFTNFLIKEPYLLTFGHIIILILDNDPLISFKFMVMRCKQVLGLRDAHVRTPHAQAIEIPS